MTFMVIWYAKIVPWVVFLFPCNNYLISCNVFSLYSVAASSTISVCPHPDARWSSPGACPCPHSQAHPHDARLPACRGSRYSSRAPPADGCHRGGGAQRHEQFWWLQGAWIPSQTSITISTPANLPCIELSMFGSLSLMGLFISITATESVRSTLTWVRRIYFRIK